MLCHVDNQYSKHIPVDTQHTDHLGILVGKSIVRLNTVRCIRMVMDCMDLRVEVLKFVLKLAPTYYTVSSSYIDVVELDCK